MRDTPLNEVPNWSGEQIARMQELWITTAEQVVAISATPGGVHSLAEHLALSEDTMIDLVGSARAKLDPALRAMLEQEQDTSQYGLGALPPKL
jgi:hypothetical protein